MDGTTYLIKKKDRAQQVKYLILTTTSLSSDLACQTAKYSTTGSSQKFSTRLVFH